MSARAKLPLDIQADIEDAHELALKKLLAELPLLFDQESILPISPVHMATPKPAKLKLQLRKFTEILFDIEASHYPQCATNFQELREWLTALATRIETEVTTELMPYKALHDFHCPS